MLFRSPGSSIPGWQAPPAAQAPPRLEPPPSPPVAPPQPTQASKGGSVLPSIFLFLCAIGGTAVGFGLFMGVAPALLAAPSLPASHSPPAVPAPPAPVSDQAVTPPEPATADATPLADNQAEFIVVAELRKLMVSCASESATGQSPLRVTAAAGEACTVTAIYQDRTRTTAVLESVSPGLSYGCFDGGDNRCQPR